MCSVSTARSINISVNSPPSFLALICLQAPRRFPGPAKMEPGALNSLEEKEVGGFGVFLKCQRDLSTPWSSYALCLKERGKGPR